MNEKYFKRAEWATYILGFFAMALSAIYLMNSGIHILEATYYEDPIPLNEQSYYTFLVTVACSVVGLIMLTYAHKLKKRESVSNIPYFIPLVVFLIEVIIFFSLAMFTPIEMLFKTFFPILAAFSLFQFYKIKQFYHKQG